MSSQKLSTSELTSVLVYILLHALLYDFLASSHRLSSVSMPRERPKIGEWNEEEAWAAFQGHVDNNDISKEDLMNLRPWHSTPWRAHKCKLKVGDVAPASKIVSLDGKESNLSAIFEKDSRPLVLVFGSILVLRFVTCF